MPIDYYNPRKSYFPGASQVIGNDSMNRPVSQYGTPAGNMPRLGQQDLTTFQLPSGGTATVKSGTNGNRTRQNLTTYQLPSGGSASVPTGSRVPSYAIQSGNQATTAPPSSSYFPAANPSYNLPQNPFMGGSQFNLAVQQPTGFQFSPSSPSAIANPSGLPSPKINQPSSGSYALGNFNFPRNLIQPGGGQPNPNFPSPTPQPRRYFD